MIFPFELFRHMIPKTAFYSPHLFCRDTSVFIIMNIRIIIIIPKSSASNLDLCPDSSQDPFRDSPQDIPRSSQYELDLELRLEPLRARSRAPFRARIRALRSSIWSSISSSNLTASRAVRPSYGRFDRISNRLGAGL